MCHFPLPILYIYIYIYINIYKWPSCLGLQQMEGICQLHRGRMRPSQMFLLLLLGGGEYPQGNFRCCWGSVSTKRKFMLLLALGINIPPFATCFFENHHTPAHLRNIHMYIYVCVFELQITLSKHLFTKSDGVLRYMSDHRTIKNSAGI